MTRRTRATKASPRVLSAAQGDVGAMRSTTEIIFPPAEDQWGNTDVSFAEGVEWATNVECYTYQEPSAIVGGDPSPRPGIRVLVPGVWHVSYSLLVATGAEAEGLIYANVLLTDSPDDYFELYAYERVFPVEGDPVDGYVRDLNDSQDVLFRTTESTIIAMTSNRTSQTGIWFKGRLSMHLVATLAELGLE